MRATIDDRQNRGGCGGCCAASSSYAVDTVMLLRPNQHLKADFAIAAQRVEVRRRCCTAKRQFDQEQETIGRQEGPACSSRMQHKCNIGNSRTTMTAVLQ